MILQADICLQAEGGVLPVEPLAQELEVILGGPSYPPPQPKLALQADWAPAGPPAPPPQPK